MARSAFITSGTGFVGLNLVQQLKTGGWDVTALHWANFDLKYLSRFSPNFVPGEIADATSILAALPSGVEPKRRSRAAPGSQGQLF